MVRLKDKEPMSLSVCMRFWLFRRFIVRRLYSNPIRPALLVIAISVATTLISSVYRVSLAGVQSFEDSLGYSAQEYPLVISPRGGGISLSDLGACLARLRSSFAVAAYRRESAELTTKRGRYVVEVVGVSGIEDQGAQSSLHGEILLSQRALHRFGLSVGESVELKLRSGSVQAAVGKAERLGGALSDSGVIVPLSRLAAEGSPSVDALLVRPLGSEPLERYQRALGEWLRSCGSFSTPMQVETSTARLKRGESLVAAYRLNVLIMASMALLVCTVLVSQATQLSLRTISRELSVLRTLGVSRSACLLGGLGAALGVTVGEPMTLWITGLFMQTAHDIYNISLGVVGQNQVMNAVVIVVGMIALCSSGSALGGLDALRVAPALGTRSEHIGVKPISSRWARLVAGTSAALGIVVVCGALSTESTLLAYLSVAGCVGAVAGATPLVIVLASRMLSRMRGSLLVWFAQGGIRTRGRGFFCALSLMVGSFRDTLEAWAGQRLYGDLFISAALEGQGNASRIPALLESEARRVSGVKRVVPYFETMSSYGRTPLVVSASDIATQIDRGVYVVRSGTLSRDLLAAGKAALVNESAVRKLGISVGGTLSVEGIRVPVVAVVQEFGTEHPLVHVDQKLFRSLYPDQDPENLTIDISSGASIGDVRRQLERVVGVLGVVRDNRELRELVLTLFDRTFQVTLSVRWIVFGIALLGLLLASLQHLWEGRREIKTMHVLGFAPNQIIGAQVVEMTVVCALPVVVGLIGGVLLGWCLTSLVNPRSFGWSLGFSLSSDPLLIAIGFVVAVAGGVGIATRSMLGRIIKEARLADE
jgi:putative ABC transport system permease protein